MGWLSMVGAKAARYLQLRQPFETCLPLAPTTPMGLVVRGGWAWTVLRSMLAFPLSLSFAELALLLGRGCPGLCWLTNGVIILYLNTEESACGFVLSLAFSTCALGLSFVSMFATTELAFRHAAAHALEALVTSLAMRTLLDTRYVVETVKTLRFLVVVFLATGPLASGLGATAVTFIRVDAGDSDDFFQSWTEHFVGNFAGNFILVYLGYLIIARCSRKQLDKVRKLLRTQSGLMYTAAFMGCAAMIGTVYSLEGLSTTQAVPLMLVVLPLLGSLSLVMPQGATATMDFVLVVSVILGTTSERGPLFALLQNDDQRDFDLCIQVTLLLSIALTAALGVAREQRMSEARRSAHANEEKLAFFTHVSHEFRTPLSVVIGYTEDLLEHQKLQPPVRVDLENILYASLGMSAMVEDLLALFRLETHGLVFSSRAVQTREFFDKVLAVATRLARPKRHLVTMDIDLPPTLVFDPNRMNQVLVNLLSNAVKFTPTGGVIQIQGRWATPQEEEAARLERGAETSSSISLSDQSSLGGSRRSTIRQPACAAASGSTVPVVPGSYSRHNNFGNGLVVDLDGSNGLLARLDNRRSSYTQRGGVISRSSRPTSRELPQPAPAAGFRVEDIKSYSTPFMVLSVTDSGPGIPPADVPRLFERFFRADTTGAEGTGLGLTICQHIATSMGGNMKVTTGNGSTFAIIVPVVEASQRAVFKKQNPSMGLAGDEAAERAKSLPQLARMRNSQDNCDSMRRRRASEPARPQRERRYTTPVSGTSPVPGGGADRGVQTQAHPALSPRASCLQECCPQRAAMPSEEKQSVLDVFRPVLGDGIRDGEAREGAFSRKACHGGFESALGALTEESARSTSDAADTHRLQMQGDENDDASAATPKSEDKQSRDRRKETGEALENGCGSTDARPVEVVASPKSFPGGSAEGPRSAKACSPAGSAGVKNLRVSRPQTTEKARRKSLDEAKAQVETAGVNPPGLRILLAEDSIPNQKLMCRILQRAGHEVEAVGDGQAAIDTLISERFDLLVLDLGLPKKAGMEVLTELRAMPQDSVLRDIPVIVSSGHVLDEHRRLCLEAGCNAFTEKPFRAKVIVETVQRVMQDHVEKRC